MFTILQSKPNCSMQIHKPYTYILVTVLTSEAGPSTKLSTGPTQRYSALGLISWPFPNRRRWTWTECSWTTRAYTDVEWTSEQRPPEISPSIWQLLVSATQECQSIVSCFNSTVMCVKCLANVRACRAIYIALLLHSRSQQMPALL